MKRNDIIDEKPSSEFRERVLNAAEKELGALRPQAVPFWQRRAVLMAGLSALAVGVLAYLYRRPQETPEILALEDHDMLENSELLNRLDLLSDLDILEVWNGKDV